MKNFFQDNLGNSLWFVDAILQHALAYNLMLWFPYYFSKLHFNFSMILISISFYVMTFPGCILLESLISCFPKKKKKLTFGFLMASFILTAILPFIEPIEENAPFYILITCLIGLTEAGPSSRVFNSEMIERTNNDTKMNYYVLLTNRLFYMLALVFFMLSIGILMQISTNFIKNRSSLLSLRDSTQRRTLHGRPLGQEFLHCRGGKIDAIRWRFKWNFLTRLRISRYWNEKMINLFLLTTYQILESNVLNVFC